MDNLRARSLSLERNPPGIIRRPDWQLHRRPTPPLDEPFARLRESMNNLRTRSPPPELLTPPPERNAIPTLQQSMENLTIIATPPPGLITPEEDRTCETEIGDEENDKEWQEELMRRDELTTRPSPPIRISNDFSLQRCNSCDAFIDPQCDLITRAADDDADDNEKMDDDDNDDDDDDDDDKSKCNDGVRCVCDCECWCMECGYRKCECDSCLITCICQTCKRERGYNSDDRDDSDNDSDDDGENKKCKCRCYCACPLCTGMTPCQNAIMYE